MNRFERLLLGASSLAVGVSGGVYGWMKYLLRTDDPYAVVNHPLQPIFLKVHILSAPVLVFALGLVFSRHVVERFQAGLPRGRRSGLVTWAAIVPMIASGYLVQTTTGAGWLKALIALHLVAGGLYWVGFLAHRVTASNGKETEAPTLGVAPPLSSAGSKSLSVEIQDRSGTVPARPSSGAMDRRASSTKAI